MVCCWAGGVGLLLPPVPLSSTSRNSRCTTAPCCGTDLGSLVRLVLLDHFDLAVRAVQVSAMFGTVRRQVWGLRRGCNFCHPANLVPPFPDLRAGRTVPSPPFLRRLCRRSGLGAPRYQCCTPLTLFSLQSLARIRGVTPSGTLVVDISKQSRQPSFLLWR